MIRFDNFEFGCFTFDVIHFISTFALSVSNESLRYVFQADQMAHTPSSLAQLWQLLRETNTEQFASLLLSNGIRSPDMLVLSADSLVRSGLPKSELETMIAGCSRPDPEPNRSRADHPTWLPTSEKASITIALMAAQPNNRQKALDFLEQDIVARSSHPAIQSRLRTWRALCAAWEVTPFPISFLNVKAVAASLKWGGYRSAQLYFQAAIGHQTRSLQVPVDPFLKALIKDVCRSIRRGLGPSALKEGFDITVLTRAINMDDSDPFDHRRAAHVADLMVVATWFMLREIELSFARQAHLYLEGPYVNIVLPVHKTNTAGGLTLRKLRCPCRLHINALCPWHAAERHLIRLMSRADMTSGQYWPLFPALDGQSMSKHTVVQTFREVLQHCGVPTTRSDGSSPPRQLFGGHCLRVSGAQYLAASGVPIALIQMLGRWSSNAIEKYIQSAPLAVVPDIPQRVLHEEDDNVWFDPQHCAMIQPDSVHPRVISDPAEAPMDFDPQLMEEDIKGLASQLADVKAMLEAPSENLIVRPRQTVVHIGTQFEKENNPQTWRTKCGWNYGTSRFFRIPHMSDEFRQCRKCFGHIGAQQEASDESDSQSEESSGSESSEPSS